MTIQMKIMMAFFVFLLTCMVFDEKDSFLR